MNKKIFKLIFLVILMGICPLSFANSDVDSDYTLIDCMNWDDSIWVAFDSGMPYKSLKKWIEATINYINSNVNKVWNEETASWKTFNIKVNCSWVNLLDWEIKLGFDWNKYKNELVIEWVWENSLIIKDSYFFLPNNSWNITFINALFEMGNKYNYYFKPESEIPKFLSSWIKIKNSNIKLKNWYNLAYGNAKYYNLTYLNWNYYPGNIKYYYSNQQLIFNSNIHIELEDDYIFAMPLFVKDSKIDFINSWTWVIHDVTFLATNKTSYFSNTNFSTIISNEIDLWWNNFKTVNNEKFAFINNKFVNFNEFIFGNDLTNINKTIFINNFIDNLISLDISKSYNLFNNVFSWEYIDEYDINNYRKNYLEESKWTKWIFWFFNRNSNYKNYQLNISSSSLYKEVTWQDIPENNQEVYIIYE